MDFLYPEITPYNEAYIEVSDIHTVHFEECGNPEGQPVLFLHGGPGGGIDPLYRRFFNPDYYRVILVNQRGSGKSTPFASLEENNTQNLIKDLETIRNSLNIDHWMVFGGSWGSTLGLAYAQAHPNNISHLILRGIYLGSERENQWLFGGQGANYLYPDYWEDFIQMIPKDERDDMIGAYYKRLTNTDENIYKPAALAWSRWEVSVSQLHHDTKKVEQYLDSPAGISMARLECHYMQHKCFLKPNQLLNNLETIRHIPCIIVHGRYDVVCAPQSAWTLHKAWPESTLHYISDAGHSLGDPSLAKKLHQCMDELAHINASA
jgi:proline iminopeptidase